jgi:hypothetical protein
LTINEIIKKNSLILLSNLLNTNQTYLKTFFMKRTFTTLFLALCVFVANAQFTNKGGGNNYANALNKPGKIVSNSEKAIGDTLLYCDGFSWFVNANDSAAFTTLREDLDGLTTHYANFFMSFGTFYDVTARPDWWMPWDVDTAFYFAATSWFTPAGQADNWLEFGPITLPAGSEISWFQRYNGSNGTPPFWYDGYEVLVSKTGMNNYTNFTDPPIFTRLDDTSSNGTDTSWAFNSVVIPLTYANQPCYFAFHHNANDMDVLYLDEIKILEGTSFGIKNNSNEVTDLQNYPNPADQNTVISYQLNNTANISLQVTDLIGRVVFTNNMGMKSAGKYNYTLNTSELNPGIYFYILSVNNHKVVNKLNIQR